MQPLFVMLPASISSKVSIPVTPCWTWTGAKQSGGYASIWEDGKSHLGHRYVWELVNGPVPEGLTLDHLCSNKLCVRPDHLEAVTRLANSGRFFGSITFCLRGHAYTPENTRTNKSGTRCCKACHKAKLRDARMERAGL